MTVEFPSWDVFVETRVSHILAATRDNLVVALRGTSSVFLVGWAHCQEKLLFLPDNLEP